MAVLFSGCIESQVIFFATATWRRDPLQLQNFKLERSRRGKTCILPLSSIRPLFCHKFQSETLHENMHSNSSIPFARWNAKEICAICRAGLKTKHMRKKNRRRRLSVSTKTCLHRRISYDHWSESNHFPKLRFSLTSTQNRHSWFLLTLPLAETSVSNSLKPTNTKLLLGRAIFSPTFDGFTRSVQLGLGHVLCLWAPKQNTRGKNKQTPSIFVHEN